MCFIPWTACLIIITWLSFCLPETEFLQRDLKVFFFVFLFWSLTISIISCISWVHTLPGLLNIVLEIDYFLCAFIYKLLHLLFSWPTYFTALSFPSSFKLVFIFSWSIFILVYFIFILFYSSFMTCKHDHTQPHS